jgi:hypothetical protein
MSFVSDGALVMLGRKSTVAELFLDDLPDTNVRIVPVTGLNLV